jgi:hypothetical protein
MAAELERQGKLDDWGAERVGSDQAATTRE